MGRGRLKRGRDKKGMFKIEVQDLEDGLENEKRASEGEDEQVDAV